MDDSEPMQIDMHDDVNENNDNEGRGEGGGGGDGQEQDGDFVVDNPSLDLETYINNYSGIAKLQRLLHVADHCPSLRTEALKMAIAHVQKTYDVQMYQHLYKKMRGNEPVVPTNSSSVLPPDVAASAEAQSRRSEGHGDFQFPPFDNQWIESTVKKSAVMLDKLDSELKNHKANSIKESIRRGFDDLGEFYLECGDLMNAVKSFTRSRDYCTSAKHVIHMCINIIKVSLYLQNWSHLINYVMKAEATPDPSDEKKINQKEAGQITAKLKCAMGLADLAQKKYKTAAKSFLQINFDYFDCPDFISQSNVAVYAALCALATFDRKELKEQVISSSSFKLFLELEPPIREVIHCFYESKYGKCLQLLDEMKDNLLLDLYLAPHVRTLYSQIRNRGMIQYFAPYASADMTKMAASFNTTVFNLENELTNLILLGQIGARMDSQKKILYVKQMDERSRIFEKALKLGGEYERKTKLMILRTAMMRAHIQVKNAIQEKEDGGRDREHGARATGIRRPPK